MKKSLVLSIIMTLVMVVAMSTATFAWYTSNNSVQATGGELTASTAAGNVTIGHTALTATYTAISWVDGSGVETPEDNPATAGKIATPYAPMMPTNATLTGFATAVQSAGGTITYTTGVNCAQYKFYLSNLNSDAINLSMSCQIANDVSGNFRWAIVTVIDETPTVISNSAFNYLTATANGVTEDATAEVLAKTGTYNLAEDANGVEFTIYVWFTGDDMENADGGSTAGFNINITQAV